MKVLVIDDHSVVRAGVSAVLTHAFDGAKVFEAGDLADALQLAAAHTDLDLALLDLNMPGIAGLEALGQLCTARPGLPVVVLSSTESVPHVRAALALGALGYIAKSASPETLAAALRLVLDGEIYVPTFVLAGDAGEARPRDGAGITGRQAEVLALVAEGLPNKIIAYRLQLSEKTVKAHVTAILRALDVGTRTEAARAARERNLLCG